MKDNRFLGVFFCALLKHVLISIGWEVGRTQAEFNMGYMAFIMSNVRFQKTTFVVLIQAPRAPYSV